MRSVRIISVLSVGIAAIAGGQDLLVRQSGSQLVVEFRPRYGEDPVVQPEQRRGSIWFESAIAPSTPSGPFVLPYRAYPVEMNAGELRLRVLEATFSERNDVRLRSSTAPESPRPGAEIRPEAQEPAPQAVAALTDIAHSQHGVQGTLRLFPLQYDRSSGALKVYSRIVVAIEGEGPPSARSSELAKPSPLSQNEWYRLDIALSGIYKLDLVWFTASGISPGALSNIESIRIFGNGGAPLPEDPAVPRPNGLEELPRYVFDVNRNGSFDPGDYVLFFGLSTERWLYQSSSRTFRHSINPYTGQNSYFLTFGSVAGRGMDSVLSTNDPAAFAPGRIQGMVFTEEETNNLLKSGRQWYGRHLDPISPGTTVSHLLPGLIDSLPVTYRVAVLGRTGTTEAFTVQEGGGSPVTIPILPVTLPSIETEYAYVAPVTTFTRTGSLVDDRSVLRFTFHTSSGEGWVDWLEIFYHRDPLAVADVLMFPSPDTSASVEHRLSGFSSRDISVFDVSRHDSVLRVTNLRFDPLDPGACAFQIPSTSGNVRTIIAVGPQGFKSPPPAVRVENSNVRGTTSGAEYVIITPKEFRVEAERLRQHRMLRDSLATMVVEIGHLYNEYSGGLIDPMAIRDFLADASTSWTTPPRYVLLFGDGHYDYKGIRTSERNWIPTYESVESIHQVRTYASDDPLALLSAGNPRVSLGLGRLPVRSVEEARVLVDKIIAYETSAPLGTWRNRATFVADDGLTSTRDDGNIHTFQAEVLAQSFTPPQIDKKKIYIVEYPTVNSSSGRRKPTAQSAIIDAINSGTLLLNYTGHGNPQQWAHEAVFTREGSLSQLVNGTRMFVLVAATCDFARFDDPSEASAGELLLTMAGGGAVGVVTASRAVYSSDNFQFNNTLYTELFRRDSAGRAPRLGDALHRTKQIHYDLNDVKYHLFADPAMRLNLPNFAAGIDSLNGQSLAAVVQIQALGKADIRGEIRLPSGGRWEEFTGTGLLEVFDARRRIIVPEWNNYSFVVDGGLLYRGEISVNAGVYSAIVPVPKDVSYGNNRARIALYAWTTTADAVGYSENVIVAGTDSTAAIDTTGPRITIFLEDETFRTGDVVSPDADLIVRLFDENGVNTSTASVGHRLEATVVSTGRTVSLSDYYRSDLDTYQSGSARYPLRDLPAGRQAIAVRAWDTRNNSSSEEIEFDVRTASDTRMYNVFNFPNPVSRSTVFTFQRNSTEPVDVTVKLYTIAGRLIADIQRTSVVDRFVSVAWDGRDGNGDPVANGVYLYKIVTRTVSGSRSDEAIGKLTMVR